MGNRKFHKVSDSPKSVTQHFQQCHMEEQGQRPVGGPSSYLQVPKFSEYGVIYTVVFGAMPARRTPTSWEPGPCVLALPQHLWWITVFWNFQDREKGSLELLPKSLNTLRVLALCARTDHSETALLGSAPRQPVPVELPRRGQTPGICCLPCPCLSPDRH